MGSGRIIYVESRNPDGLAMPVAYDDSQHVFPVTEFMSVEWSCCAVSLRSPEVERWTAHDDSLDRIRRGSAAGGGQLKCHRTTPLARPKDEDVARNRHPVETMGIRASR